MWRSAFGSVDSGVARSASTKQITAIGTLIQKTERHSHSVRKPPIAGPMPATIVPAVPQTPIAVPSSPSTNTLRRIESEAGVRIAAPTPIAATPMISSTALGASDAPRAASP